jgi:hypothetical protein
MKRLALSSAITLPVTLVGLVLLFVGERIIQETASARIALSGLGMTLVVAMVAFRIVIAHRAEGQHKTSERTMAIVALVGGFAVVGYFTTAEPFSAWMVGGMSSAAQQRFGAVMTVAWIVLLLISVVPQVFGEIAMWPMRHAEHIEWRRVRDAVYAGLTLAFAASYGALAVYGASELGVRADYSYFKTSRPSESTLAMLAPMAEDVRVIAFFPPVNEVRDEVMGYLRELQRQSPNVRLEEQDRLLAPALAKEAKVFQDGVIVLMRGAQTESIAVGTEIKAARKTLRQLDTEMQKALTKVLRAQRTAYLTAGHGELNDTKLDDVATGRSALGVKELLEVQNYVIRDLSFVQGLGRDVPEDATVVLVLGPTEPFAPEELASLERYAARGGRLLLALEPEGKANNEQLAKIAGLKFNEGLLCNEESHGIRRRNPSDHAIVFSNRFSTHPSVASLRRLGSRAVFFLNAGSIDKQDDAAGEIDFSIQSLQGTWADLNGNFLFDDPDETKGVFRLVASVTRPLEDKKNSKENGTENEKQEPVETRMVVVADGDALSDATLMNPSHFNGNPQFVVDVIRWLGGEEAFSGLVASTEDVRIEHTKQKDKAYFYLTIFGVPALVLAMGWTGLRRRRRAKEGRKA